MNLRNILKRKAPKPKERVLYAITNGTYMGVCVVFIRPELHPIDGFYSAMAIGDKDFDGGLKAMKIPEKDVTEGIQKKILDKIRRIPPELYHHCIAEYNERERMQKKPESVTTDESTD